MKEISRSLILMFVGFSTGSSIGTLLLGKVIKTSVLFSIFCGVMTIFLLIFYEFRIIKSKYRDFKGDLKGGLSVTYEGQLYTTGNRYNGLVELYQDNKFCATVDQKDCKPVWQKPKWMGHVGFLK